MGLLTAAAVTFITVERYVLILDLHAIKHVWGPGGGLLDSVQNEYSIATEIRHFTTAVCLELSAGSGYVFSTSLRAQVKQRST